jgi:hypothetical protein
MDYSIEEYGEEEFAGTFPDANLNGLGFLGGPSWDYPEEEIEFSPSNEVENDDDEDQHDNDYALEEHDDIESCSGASTSDHIRMAMIENYIATHDIHDDDRDLLHDVCNINIEYSVPQPPPTAPITEQDAEITNGSKDIDGNDHSNVDVNASNSSNNNMLPPQTSPLVAAPKNKRPTRISNSSTRSKRRRREKVRNSTDAKKNNGGQQLHTFREAALCVPYEYTTKNATFYIRRPYGVDTVPEIFRVLSPHTTDKEYKRRSRVSSSETIQVAIVVSADNSLMLLHGSAGVRYKTDPSDVLCDDWVDVPDVGLMDVPLGYVNIEHHEIGNQNSIEYYSLDEILEEAMLVREQYCSTILNVALEIDQHRSLAKAKSQIPPSLAKSIVSTPPRNIYYYDGSSNIAKVEEEEQQEEITGRKLDFYNMSPSLTRGSNETSTTHRQSSRHERQRKLRRRRLYQFCQRLVIVVGFYICGIFLVANLSVVDYHRPTTVDPGFKTSFANNMLSWMFPNTAEDKQQQIEVISGDETPANGEDALHLFQTTEHFAANTTKNELIESDCSAFMEGVSDERDVYKRALEATQTLLREQVEQNNDLSNKYHSERTKTEELQKAKDDAEVLANNLIHETEALVVNSEIEQGQRRKLEEKMRELEIEIMTLKKETSQMKQATGSYFFNTSVEMTKGFEIPVLDGQMNTEEYQVQHEQPSKKEVPGAIMVDFFDVTKPVDESRSLQEEEDSTDDKQLVALKESLPASPKYGMQSMESFILKNARANKGPIIPKVYRQLTKRFEAHGSRRDESNSHNKVGVFASSVKDAISHNFEKIALGRRHIGNGDSAKQSKESSDMVRRQVKKNVDEALDRGQDAINVIGGFAKTKLKSVGDRVGGFATKKWRERRERSNNFL